MSSCGNCKVCCCRECNHDAKPELKSLAIDWVAEPWSTWLPAMITADYWQHYEPSDLYAPVLLNGCSDGSKLDLNSTSSKRYFCTSCPQSGSLLPHEVLADHALHATIGISRLWNCTGVLYDELKEFFDVSEIKKKYGIDGKSYLQLRSLARPDRRATFPDAITCAHCTIVKLRGSRSILTSFCSVECQFSSKLSPDAAILFALMVPEETHRRKFHIDIDSRQAPVQKKGSKINTRMDIDVDHNFEPAFKLPSASLSSVQYRETLSPVSTAIRDMQIG